MAKRLTRNLNEVPSSPGKGLKVVEEEGAPVIAAIRRTDLFRDQSCRFKDSKCIVEGGKDCGGMGCIYKITCTSYQEPVDLAQGEKENRDPGD